MDKAKGSAMTDANGNVYVDDCSGYGPLILDHEYPAILKTVYSLFEQHDTWHFGTPTEMELKLAHRGEVGRECFLARSLLQVSLQTR